MEKILYFLKMAPNFARSIQNITSSEAGGYFLKNTQNSLMYLGVEADFARKMLKGILMTFLAN